MDRLCSYSLEKTTYQGQVKLAVSKILVDKNYPFGYPYFNTNPRLILGFLVNPWCTTNCIRFTTTNQNYFLFKVDLSGLSQNGLLHLEQAIGFGLSWRGSQTYPHWLHLHASTCTCPIILLLVILLYIFYYLLIYLLKVLIIVLLI